MHVPNRPTPGATRQLPDSRTTEATGDAVGAGAAGAATGEAVGEGTGKAVGATANTATAPVTVGGVTVTPVAVA